MFRSDDDPVQKPIKMSFIEQLEYWGFSEDVISTLTESDIDFETLVTMTPQDFDIYNIKISLGNRIRLFKCAKEYMKSLNVQNNSDLNENMTNSEQVDVKPNIETIETNFGMSKFDEMVEVHPMHPSNDENVRMNSNNFGLENRRVDLNSWKRKSELTISQPSFKKLRENELGNSSQSSHLNEEPKNSRRFIQAFKLNDANVCKEAIGVILRDSLEGEAIIAEYENKGTLDESSRNLLVSLVINRCDVRNVRKPPAFLEAVAGAIVDLLPHENRDIYFISARTVGNVSKNTKGKLTSKWRNIMTRMRQAGILERKNRILQTPKQTVPPVEASAQVDENISDLISWLEKSQQSWDEIKPKWEQTFEYRMSRNSELLDVEKIIKQWPVLDSDFGPQLVELDFSKQHPNKNFIIDTKWESFFQDIYNLRKSNIRDECAMAYCKNYDLHCQSKSHDLDGLRVLILPYLMPPTSRVKTPVGTKKPFIAECAEGFVVWAKTKEDAVTNLEIRAQRYKDLQLPYQPCVLLVGPTVMEIESSYVELGRRLWKASSPRHAIDLLFKVFMSFNLKYPFDCEQVWLLIQKLLYNIETVNDKRIGIVSSVMASIQALK